MANKIMIDGVDVSECSWYKQGATGMICADWLLSNDCSKNLNCYYKQLKRKEKECEKLKAENEELKNTYKTVKLKIARIEDYCNNNIYTFSDGTKVRYTMADEILDIINKAKDGE